MTSPACYLESRGEEGPPRERVGGDIAGKCSGKSLRAEEEGRRPDLGVADESFEDPRGKVKWLSLVDSANSSGRFEWRSDVGFWAGFGIAPRRIV